MILKTLHIILALNIFLSTTGASVFEHLCQKKGRTIALFTQPKNCCKKEGATEIKPECEKEKCCKKVETQNNDISLTQKPCCQDKVQFVKSETNRAIEESFSASDFKFKLIPVRVFYLAEHFDIIPPNQKILRFYLYKPPPMVSDIRVLIQSFLC